jgi:hypothetical protein
MYYRGPSAKKETELDAHRQIEDNATKALINVLEHGVPNIARSFAERFAPSIAGDWPPDTAASFYLQGGPHKPFPGPRILLGLSIAGALDPQALPAKAEAHGRIDAAIVSPHGRLIAVETKVVELLDPHQLARHCKDWNIALDDAILARWVDVWAWARDARADASDGVSRFLLGQFCEYLEIHGFGRWAGFREEDFAQVRELVVASPASPPRPYERVLGANPRTNAGTRRGLAGQDRVRQTAQGPGPRVGADKPRPEGHQPDAPTAR